MVNRERMTSHVEDLIRIDSESKCERDVAHRLQEELESLGASVQVDDAGSKYGGNTGNVIAYLKGTQPGVPPFLLSAHMDTVPPGKGVRPSRTPKAIKTDGTTVLGGDDKSGLSIIMEVLRTLKDKEVPHGDLEIAFTICEEIGLLGAKALDPGRFRSKMGLVLDSENAGILTTRGPGAVRMEVEVRGKEAHAGVAPEKGVSAIKIASAAISKMKLGRIDKETTANIGTIAGGVATNIIPNRVLLKGEARSLNPAKLKTQVRHMKSCFVSSAAKLRGKVKVRVDGDYTRLNIGSAAAIVKLAKAAAQKFGYKLSDGATGGGSDANVYNRWGVQTANLGTGMRDIHTVAEWLDLDDFERSANLVAEMIALYSASSG